MEEEAIEGVEVYARIMEAETIKEVTINTGVTETRGEDTINVRDREMHSKVTIEEAVITVQITEVEPTEGGAIEVFAQTTEVEIFKEEAFAQTTEVEIFKEEATNAQTWEEGSPNSKDRIRAIA